MSSNELFALSLSVMAGLATLIGSVIIVFTNRTNTKFLSASLGFSAGVMLYVSMAEIYIKAKTCLCEYIGARAGSAGAAGAFFFGIIMIGVIDYIIPSAQSDIGSSRRRDSGSGTLRRMGILTAVAIGIHNFPEGLATFTSALKDPHLGLAISAAIAIHNIPEGIAAAAPIYYSSGSRAEAFRVSFLSGITEPAGAVIGYLLLRPFFNDLVFGILFGTVSGIMVFISVEELLPMAREYEKSKIPIISVISGMAVMALSLILFE